MATAPQDVELSDDQKRQLAALADQAGKPWPNVFSEALHCYRQQRATTSEAAAEQTLYDALQDNGLIGIVKNSPSDLATNPEHMDGFGRD